MSSGSVRVQPRKLKTSIEVSNRRNLIQRSSYTSDGGAGLQKTGKQSRDYHEGGSVSRLESGDTQEKLEQQCGHLSGAGA